MELEFETRTTDYLRQSIEGVCRQEQTLEVIVPDASPDAAGQSRESSIVPEFRTVE